VPTDADSGIKKAEKGNIIEKM